MRNTGMKRHRKTMVQRMMDGVQVQGQILITLAKDHIQNHLMGDWIGAVSHMSTKIAMAFPPKAGLKYKARGGDPRKISEAGQGRGRGGKGRGGRDGRGRGRSGQGENGLGRGGNITTFNGVDTSDHTYNFSDNEMTKMGRDGRTSVFDRCN